jgi:hypothetical protein
MQVRNTGVIVLVAAIGSSCGGKARSSTPTPLSTPSPTAALVPTPIAPSPGAVVDNACGADSWLFDWSDTQASAYHLQVFAPGGGVALDVDDIRASAYTWTLSPAVRDAERVGWRWRVQAMIGGSWRDWSPETSFDVDVLAPRVLAPAAGAVLDNGCRNGDEIAWDLAWSSCRGADRYHLYVIGSNASIPVIDEDNLRDTSYRHRSPGFIAAGNDRNWRLQVQARIDGQWTAARTQTFVVETEGTDCGTLAAPTQLAPPDGAVYSHFPRTLTLEWSAVPNASSYGVDLEVCPPQGCTTGTFPWTPPIRDLRETSHTLNFVGAQPGRWRVWATNGSGMTGAVSPWREFRFTN